MVLDDSLGEESDTKTSLELANYYVKRSLVRTR